MLAREAGLNCALETAGGWSREGVDRVRNSFREFENVIAEVAGFLAPLLVGKETRVVPAGSYLHESVFSATKDTQYRPWILYMGNKNPVVSLSELKEEAWGDEVR